jgi:hypothetical protein
MTDNEQPKKVDPEQLLQLKPVKPANSFGPQTAPPKAAMTEFQDMVNTREIGARILFGTVVGGLSGLAFGVMEASNQIKLKKLAYNSRAGLNLGINVMSMQGVWFAGYFATFQVFKYVVCKAVGNNDPSTTAVITAGSFLPLAAVRIWRPYVPCALMLCGLDFYHSHKDAFGL